MSSPTILGTGAHTEESRRIVQKFPRNTVIISKLGSIEQAVRNLITNFNQYTLLITPAHFEGLPASTTEILADELYWIDKLRYNRKILPKLVILYQAEHIFVNLNGQLQSHIISVLYQISEKLVVTVRHDLYSSFKVLGSLDKIIVYDDGYTYIAQMELLEQRQPQPRVLFSRFWEVLGIF